MSEDSKPYAIVVDMYPSPAHLEYIGDPGDIGLINPAFLEVISTIEKAFGVRLTDESYELNLGSPKVRLGFRKADASKGEV